MPIEENRARALNLHPMVEHNTDNHETAFTVSIDHITLLQVFQLLKEH